MASPAEQLARVFIALLVIALVISVIQGGPTGARQWIRAKFLGRV